MADQSVTATIAAPRAAIYRALLDRDAIAAWRVPDGMRSEVHEFEPREGGRFRVSLHYEDPASEGKSDEHTDTYHGHFRRLVPDTEVVEVVEFEASDAALRGPMTVTTTLAAVDAGTDVTIAFENLPDAVAPADNALGTRIALDKLAALLTGP